MRDSALLFCIADRIRFVVLCSVFIECSVPEDVDAKYPYDVTITLPVKNGVLVKLARRDPLVSASASASASASGSASASSASSAQTAADHGGLNKRAVHASISAAAGGWAVDES